MSRRSAIVVAVVVAVLVGASAPAVGVAVSPSATDSEGSAAPTTPGPIPDEVDIGSAEVGESTERTFTFENPTDETVEVSGMSISGEDAGAFTIVSGGGSVTVEPGESHTVTVRFSPTHVGDHDAIVSADSNAPGSPQAVVLDGEGLEPAEPVAELSPESYDFGGVQVENTATTTFVLKNAGDEPLAFEDASLSGSEEFALAGSGSGVLDPGERVTFEVQYSPAEPGQSEATLEIATNDTDRPTVTATIVGEGIETDLDVSSSSLSFGEQRVDEPAQLTVTLTNDGTEPISVTDLAITGDGQDVFSIVEGESTTIEPDSSVEVTVEFVPDSAKGYGAKLSVETATEAVSGLDVSLSGVGTSPNIWVTPPDVNFGKTVTDEVVRRDITVRNKGNEPLELDGFEIVGANPGVFQVVGGPGSFTIPPGATEILTVQFTPTESGKYSATLLIESDDPEEATTSVYLSNTRTSVKQQTRSDRRNGTTESDIEVSDAEDNSKLTFAFSTSTASSASTATSASARGSPALFAGAAADQPAGDANVSLDVMNMTVKRGGDFSLSVTASAAELETTPNFELLPRNGTQPVGYLQVGHSISDENIAEVEFKHRVSKSTLEELDATIEDYALYRYVDGEWVELEYTVVGETGSYYVVEATSPGLSDFTSGVKQPKFRVVDANVTVTKITRGDDVGVRVEIRNDGGSDGTYTTQLILNDEVVTQKDVTIAADSKRVVTFEREITEAGTYTVRVNDIEVDQVEVDPAEVEKTESTPDGTSEPDVEETAIPGFGMGVALVALLAVAMLARRRT